MAAFDYSSLSPEQTKIALQVVDSAKKYNLNPDLIVPLIMAESGMSHIPSAKKNKEGLPISNGVMQLTPGTAAQYGVADYQSPDVAANIDAGMRFLRDLAANPAIGNDPKKMIAGYNAGPRSAYVRTGDEKDLFPETRAHIANIHKYSLGNTLASPTTSAKKTAADAQPSDLTEEEKAEHAALMGADNTSVLGSTGPVATQEDAAEHAALMGEDNAPWAAAPPPIVAEGSPYGAMAGAVVGGTLSGGANIAGGLMDRFGPKVPNAISSAVLDPANADLTAGEKWRAKVGYGKGKGTVQDVVTAAKRAESKGPVSSKMDKAYGVRQAGEPASLVDRLIYRTKMAEEAERQKVQNAKIAGEAANAAQLEAVKDAQTKTVTGRAMNTAGNALRGGLSGVGALYGLDAATDAAKKNEYWQAMLHGLSGTASAADMLASVLPTVGKAAVRTFAAPVAIAADTGANLVKHYRAGEYSKMPVDVGIGALGAIPWAGIPLSMGASYLRDRPELFSKEAPE